MLSYDNKIIYYQYISNMNKQNHPAVPSKAEIISKIRNLHEYLQREYHVSEIGLFGSVIREEATIQSDLDILVSFTEPPDLFTFIRLEQYLTDKLGIKVDLVLKDSLKPHIGKYILSEVVYT
jgi:hypothetical protein